MLWFFFLPFWNFFYFRSCHDLKCWLSVWFLSNLPTVDFWLAFRTDFRRTRTPWIAISTAVTNGMSGRYVARPFNLWVVTFCLYFGENLIPFLAYFYYCSTRISDRPICDKRRRTVSRLISAISSETAPLRFRVIIWNYTHWAFLKLEIGPWFFLSFSWYYDDGSAPT